MENPNDSNKETDIQTGLRFIVFTLLGIAFLNAAVFALDGIFPGNLNGIEHWFLVEFGIVAVASGFASDLQKEKQKGRSWRRYGLVYPVIWFGLGLAAYLAYRTVIA